MSHINQYDWHETTTQEELAQGRRSLIRGLEKGSRVPTLEERTGKKEDKRNMSETLAIEHFDTSDTLNVGLSSEAVELVKGTWTVHEDGIRGYLTDPARTVHVFYPWSRIQSVMQLVK